jgi:hypothetical protein
LPQLNSDGDYLVVCSPGNSVGGNQRGKCQHNQQLAEGKDAVFLAVASYDDEDDSNDNMKDRYNRLRHGFRRHRRQRRTLDSRLGSSVITFFQNRIRASRKRTPQ